MNLRIPADMPAGASIAMAQLNAVVGDPGANAAALMNSLQQAQDDPQLTVFPELFISGYPADDLWLRRDFIDACERETRALALGIPPGRAVLVGAPAHSGGGLYNAAWLLRRDHAEPVHYKQELPKDGVFDEPRHFRSGDSLRPFKVGRLNLCAAICEDLWQPRIAGAARKAGADLLIGLNASPFHVGKQQTRLEILRQRVRESGLPIINVNLVGGQDDLIFDGCSVALDSRGGLILQLAAMEADRGLIQVMPEGRLQTERDSCGKGDEPWPRLLYKALVLGIRDYVDKNGFSHVLLGLSGGIDSALTAALAVDALGAKRVSALMLPYRYTSDMSLEDAAELAARLGIEYRQIPIGGLVQQACSAIDSAGAGGKDVAYQNIQARSRALVLMGLANREGSLLLATGNKSEYALGYATLYGDMAGGYAPLKDVYKTQIYALAGLEGTAAALIPQRIRQRPPSAELAPNQIDSDSMPAYEKLDLMLRGLIEEDLGPNDIAARHGFEEAEVRSIAGRMQGAEYKRRQAPPGPRVSCRAFGRERRYPLTSGSWWRQDGRAAAKEGTDGSSSSAGPNNMAAVS